MTMKIFAVPVLLLALVAAATTDQGLSDQNPSIREEQSVSVIGYPAALANDATNGQLLIAATAAHAVHSIAYADGAPTGPLPVGGSPTSIRVVSSSGKAYVLDSESLTLTVLRLQPLGVAGAVDLTGYAVSVPKVPNLLFSSSDETKLYVFASALADPSLGRRSERIGVTIEIDVATDTVTRVAPLFDDRLASRSAYAFDGWSPDPSTSVIMYKDKYSYGLIFQTDPINYTSEIVTNIAQHGCEFIDAQTRSVFVFSHDHFDIYPLDRVLGSGETSVASTIDVGDSRSNLYGSPCSLSFDGASRVYVVDPLQRYLALVDVATRTKLTASDLEEMPGDVEAIGASGEFALSFPEKNLVKLYRFVP